MIEIMVFCIGVAFGVAIGLDLGDWFKRKDSLNAKKTSKE